MSTAKLVDIKQLLGSQAYSIQFVLGANKLRICDFPRKLLCQTIEGSVQTQGGTIESVHLLN